MIKNRENFSRTIVTRNKMTYERKEIKPKKNFSNKENV